MNNKLFLLFLFVSACMISETSGKINVQTVRQTLESAQKNAWNTIREDIWVFPPYLGPMFLSEYYFELEALKLTSKSQFNITHFNQLLLQTQLEDGSWVQVEDKFLTTGQLDATIFNYWYLKSVGVDPESYGMQKAKYWILKNGGIEAAQTMSHFKLAAFGHYSWDKLTNIPLFIFNKEGFMSSLYYIKDYIAQWVYPHLTALAYLRHFSYVKKVGADIRELWLNYPSDMDIKETSYPSACGVSDNEMNLVREMLNLRQKLGSFGAYTISTILTMLALDDFGKRFPGMLKEEINSSIEKGFNFIEFNYFNYLESYQGTLDDGRWWDTLLVTWGLLESGEDPAKLIPTIDK